MFLVGVANDFARAFRHRLGIFVGEINLSKSHFLRFACSSDWYFYGVRVHVSSEFVDLDERHVSASGF